MCIGIARYYNIGGLVVQTAYTPLGGPNGERGRGDSRSWFELDRTSQTFLGLEKHTARRTPYGRPEQWERILDSLVKGRQS